VRALAGDAEGHHDVEIGVLILGDLDHTGGERPAELVAAEVRDGVLSRAAARRDYGVEVDAETFEVERVTGGRRP